MSKAFRILGLAKKTFYHLTSCPGVIQSDVLKLIIFIELVAKQPINAPQALHLFSITRFINSIM